MKISGGKKLFTLYKKDLAASKFETLLILGFITVGNLFLLYKAQTSWPLDMSMALSTLFLGFVPLFTFFKAFNFIREEWKENTIYFMMSLPTTGNTIFLSKFLAMLTQFFILEITAVVFIAIFMLMNPGMQQVWEAIRDVSNMGQIVWEFSKIGVIASLSFSMVIITAFFSSVVGKLFKRFSGLITFIVFIAMNVISTKSITKIIELINRGGLNPYIQKEMMVEGTTVFVQVLPNSIFVPTIILTAIVSVLVFLATATIYDRKVEL
ncbi:MAG: hypothetical protein ACOCG5_09370 [Candidatus Alkaliphilus sp. MAG34]|nr:hypothetical protein [Clostridiales bacterium]